MTKAVSKPRRNAKQVAKPETRQEPDEFDNMATERAMKRLKGVRGRYRVDPQPGDIVRSPHKDETGNALAMFAAFGTTSADFAMNSIAELASVVRGQREFPRRTERSEEHTSDLQSLMRISFAVFCLKTKPKASNQPNP